MNHFARKILGVFCSTLCVSVCYAQVSFDPSSFDYWVFLGGGNSGVAGYENTENTFLATNNSTESAPGFIQESGTPVFIAEDLVAVSMINAVVDEDGNVQSGTFALIGGSESLGIAPGTALISAKITAVEYNSIDALVYLRAIVNSISPALRAVIGEIQSVTIVEYFADINFDADPWNATALLPSALASPDIYLSSDILPLSPEEMNAPIFAFGNQFTPATTYDSTTDLYSFSISYGGGLGQPGVIAEYPNSGFNFVQDIVGDLNLSAVIDEEGVVSSGTISWTGQSTALGISTDQLLLSGTIREATFGFRDTLTNMDAPVFEFLIDVSAVHPNLALIIGSVETVLLYDYQSPPMAFVDDPWSISFSDAFYPGATGPNLFFSEEQLVNIDLDGDGIATAQDNCTNASNGDQRDADNDGIGSACDADLNNDCIVNFLDVGTMANVFFTGDANADVNGDGVVNFLDFVILPQQLFRNYTLDSPSSTANICSSE